MWPPTIVHALGFLFIHVLHPFVHVFIPSVTRLQREREGRLENIVFWWLLMRSTFIHLSAPFAWLNIIKCSFIATKWLLIKTALFDARIRAPTSSKKWPVLSLPHRALSIAGSMVQTPISWVKDRAWDWPSWDKCSSHSQKWAHSLCPRGQRQSPSLWGSRCQAAAIN